MSWCGCKYRFGGKNVRVAERYNHRLAPKETPGNVKVLKNNQGGSNAANEVIIIK